MFSSVREWKNTEHLLLRICGLGYPVHAVLSTNPNPEIETLRRLVGAAGFPLHEILVSQKEAKKRKLGKGNVCRLINLLTKELDPGLTLQAANHYHLSPFDVFRKFKQFTITAALQWGIADLVPELCVDKYLMFGSFSKDELTAKGVPANRLFVVGNPGWDSLKEMKIEDNNSIVYYAQTRHTPKRIIIDQLHLDQLLSYFPDKHLIIKEHPARYGEYAPYAKYPRITVIQDQVETVDLLRQASINITTGSTCAVESMLLGKPTIVLNISKGDIYIPSGQVITTDFDTLRKRCEALFKGVVFNEEQLERFKERIAYSYKTYDATDRVIEVLLGWFHHGESTSRPRF